MGTLLYMYTVLQYLKTCLWVEYAPYRAGITILKTQALKCREACQVTEHPFFKETRFPEEQPWLESTSS